MAQTLIPATTHSKIRCFSFGGGVQSNAVLAMQAMGKLSKPYDIFVFADVGEDSEHPDTVAYVRDISIPFAKAHNIRFEKIQKTTWGEPETLLAYMYRQEKSVPIPMYMPEGAPGNRGCTADFKIRAIDKYFRSLDVTHVIMGLGISLDEFQRARDTKWHHGYGKKKYGFFKKREYPLIDARMNRMDALNVVNEAGLPRPPRSACWFCPFTSRGRWIEMKRNNPELFEQAVALEEHINALRNKLGRDNVFLHRDVIPLREAVPNQLPLPGFLDDTGDECDSGYCFV